MRVLRRPQVEDPKVSTSEQELFGGPLRYDMGWTEHEHARLELTLWTALRSTPHQVWGTLRRAWRADRGALLSVGACEIGQGIVTAVNLLVLNAVMHALLGTGTPADRVSTALPALLVGAGAAVVNSGLASWSTSRAGRLEPLVERIATTEYLDAAQAVELEAIEDPAFRRLLDVAYYGPTYARRMISTCVAGLNSTIGLVSTAGILLVLHWALIPMLLLIVAPRGWGAMRVAQRRYVSVLNWVEHLRASRLIGNLLTERSAAQEVRLHGVGPYLLARYRDMAENAEEEQQRLANGKAATELLATAMSGLATAATYTVMFWLITGGRMSLAVAGTAVFAIRSGSASLGSLVMNVNDLHEESLYVQDHERFLVEAARRAIPRGGAELPARIDAIVLDQVGYQYPDRDEPALDEVSLSLPMGSVTAVVGDNGAGKSTLVKIISGLLVPTTGSVSWGGSPVARLDRFQLFERVGQLTQDFQRWPMTAAMNIRIGRPNRPATEAELDQSVQFAGAAPVLDKLPDGLNTLLARMFRGATELSGGEWQKVGLARSHWRTETSIADSVLIVDEPTSALDPEAEIRAFDRIRELAAPHRAVVLVTHRMSGVRWADQIYVLNKGRVVEHGTHDELIAANNQYASMFRVQAAQYATTLPRPARPTAAESA
ncbi:ABC transporter ATP-binding protein/permease [Streptomyces sp. A3M-1-3]|uniref:ABC transporter ATP-binding protein n=1 Tax=Streptomyces sp. A3M-1-3 TaxID=2962044 RepID=UPI0020B642A5|nr:ABC transporter ATP-binding protein [Streptomyces sp. A3M-1-3]MCP3821843.1 ABC transporter ATP-binding protein/permease [Streptomyces sp. A3M-1-3]